MNCVLCRHDIYRKCRHEIVCEAKSRLEIAQPSEGPNGGENVHTEAEPGRSRDDGHPGGNGESSDDYSDDEGGNGVGSGGQDVGGNEADRTAGNVDGVSNEDVPVDVQEILAATGLEISTVRSDGGSGNGRRSINGRTDRNKRKIYYPIAVKRSFFMCDVEVKRAEHLAHLIETNAASGGALAFGDPDGKQCCGIYLNEAGKKTRCDVTRKKSSSDIPRKVTLFTLGHGEFTVLLLDWVCHVCGYENHYSGEQHGIFPAAWGVTYTVELMYWWIGEMCTNTRSFRSVYQSSRKLQQTPSYNKRIETGRLPLLSSSYLPNRRVANDAIRKFIHSVYVDTPAVSGDLFSCSKCELEMEEQDFVQLGLDRIEHAWKKRLRRVVVDAKVVALLKDTERCCDEHDVLTGVPGLIVRIVRNRQTQNALRTFLKSVRGAITGIRNLRASGNPVSSSLLQGKWFAVKDGQLLVRLGAIAKYASTASQKKTVI